MKKQLQYFTFAIVVLLTACASESEKNTKYLIGSWETIYYKMEMTSFQRKDTVVVYDIDFKNPGDERAKRNGVSFTSHKEDGTFETWQEKNKRPVGPRIKGKWRVTKDSLFYKVWTGKDSIEIPFQLQKIEDGFSISGLQDGDRDGAVDDTVYIEAIRTVIADKK